MRSCFLECRARSCGTFTGGWAEHGCGEEVYAQYSVLEHVDAEDATVSALKEKTRLDILMDDTHPVLLLQLAPASPLAPVTEALASACGREGWTLCVK